MANFDWHVERSGLSNIALLDRAPESEDIDLKRVRMYRQARVREQMVRYGVDALILSGPHQYPLRDRHPEHAGLLAAERSLTLPATDRSAFHSLRVHRLSAPR